MPVSKRRHPRNHCLGSLAALVSHLVDRNRHRQDQNIILAGVDRHAVAVAQALPLKGYLRHLNTTFVDALLVIEYISFHLQIGSIMVMTQTA